MSPPSRVNRLQPRISYESVAARETRLEQLGGLSLTDSRADARLGVQAVGIPTNTSDATGRGVG